ncbi:spore coat protein F [Halalkalibacter wakoensis JCM 9140]|uniref:Spore coat protein F n=1 Tax=Halalkalibacter wakoensis JCM 9140 TaxID=1236970 RepID=W4PY38_9BACI|nr:spore coat protein [Halalkalibacter wakoensis]GAE24388.1 spore coat protein F [Halalkalibacter wakoensis JCM 9140]
MENKELSVTDHTIATDLLFETKAAIKDFAAAITESTTPEVRHFFTQQLRNAIGEHEQIYGFLQDRGIYDAYNVPQQLQKDIQYANRALEVRK